MMLACKELKLHIPNATENYYWLDETDEGK